LWYFGIPKLIYFDIEDEVSPTYAVPMAEANIVVVG
jgi:hypothetical protein